MSLKPISPAHFPNLKLETDYEETKDWLDSLSEVIFGMVFQGLNF